MNEFNYIKSHTYCSGSLNTNYIDLDIIQKESCEYLKIDLCYCFENLHKDTNYRKQCCEIFGVILSLILLLCVFIGIIVLMIYIGK